MMDWPKMIDAARAENANGVSMRAGKRYTTTAIRVEMMRRHAGDLGITTEIIHWATENGQPIVVKATIADETGRVLATGHAEEIRGNGNVNKTSALENAETSAIGRALAALGLSGGEFASANEMDGVERKADAQTDAAAAVAAVVSSLTSAADTPTLTTRWRGLTEAERNTASILEAYATRYRALNPKEGAT